MGRSVIKENLDGQLKVMDCKPDALVHGTVRPIAGSLLVAGALFCLGLMSVPAQTAPPAPDHGWVFSERNGDVTSPSFGSVDGKLSGGVEWSSEDPFSAGGSVSFDGTDGTVVMDDLAQGFNGLGNFSLSIWIKANATGIDKGFWEAVDSGGGDLWGLRYDSTGATAGGSNLIKLGITTSESGGNTNRGADQQESHSGTQTTQWQNIVMTWEDGAGFNLYIDGVLDEPTSAMQNTEGTTAMMDRFVLGDGAKASWDGLIDEVAVWTSTLTAENAVWLAKNSIAWLGLENGLVAYYPFNGNANDESGNGNDGEVNGATLATDRNGDSGKAYSFDGVDDFIRVNSPNGLEAYEVKTISSWFTPSASDVPSGRLITKYQNDTDENGWFLGLHNQKLEYYYKLPGRPVAEEVNSSSTLSFTSGVAVHLAATITKTGLVNLYLNGKIVGSENIELLPQPYKPNDRPLLFGAGLDSGGVISKTHTKGQLDDIRIYNRALSEAEVAALYELEKAVTRQNILQSSDLIIASSLNSPGSEGAANAIDGKPTKYLNFDSSNSQPSGFVVTPGIGSTTITGISMQSANDAPDRDVKVVLIEGTNDSVSGWDDGASWTKIAQIDDIPAYTDRFQTQKFFFSNNKAYTSYRWTVLDTQGPSSCCMQVAEVGLLAVIGDIDCDFVKFNRQPADAFVLDGESASFLVEVNGPWPLQWYKNGEPIPGATSPIYTTEPVNSGNVADKYSVKIGRCKTSNEVKASLLDPSAHPVSIGLTFNGSGANGAPTAMNPTDVAGVQLQAHWNNVTNASGGNESPLVNSRGQEARNAEGDTVTIDFASSGNWGAGTGDSTPTQRLLNGLIHSQPDSDSYIQFQNVPEGNHTLVVYTVGIPLQFQDQFYKLVGDGDVRTVYTDQMNVDQYNRNEGYYLGTSTDPNIRTLSNYVRFDNVKPVDGLVRFEWGTTTTGFDRGVAVNAVQLLLDNPALSVESPVVVSSPVDTSVYEWAKAKLSVQVTGGGLKYQWYKDGAIISDGGKFSGATTDTLTVNGVIKDDEGTFNLVISNDGISVMTSDAKLKLKSLTPKFNDGLVAYYPFNGNANDESVNGNHGEVNGATLTEDRYGVQESAFSFDGDSSSDDSST